MFTPFSQYLVCLDQFIHRGDRKCLVRHHGSARIHESFPHQDALPCGRAAARPRRFARPPLVGDQGDPEQTGADDSGSRSMASLQSRRRFHARHQCSGERRDSKERQGRGIRRGLTAAAGEVARSKRESKDEQMKLLLLLAGTAAWAVRQNSPACLLHPKPTFGAGGTIQLSYGTGKGQPVTNSADGDGQLHLTIAPACG